MSESPTVRIRPCYARPMLTDEQKYNAELGSRIREARGDISKSRFARAVGIPRTSLILIERGEQPVQAYMLIRMAQELSVDPADLLLGRDAPLGGDSRTDVGVAATPAIQAFVASVRQAARTRRGT
jgi:transcriptional regulator with XRE-family HTH domain